MNIYKKNNIKLRNKDRNTEKIIVWCINKSLQLLTELLKAVVKLKPETLKLQVCTGLETMTSAYTGAALLPIELNKPTGSDHCVDS